MSHSQLQKMVLRLYREFLKVSARNKEMREIVKREFRAQASSVTKRDLLHIEFMLRIGKNQLKRLKNADNVARIHIK